MTGSHTALGGRRMTLSDRPRTRKPAACSRKQAEEAFRESEERYRRLVEVSPDAIFVNRQGKLVFINQAGLRLFGATRPEQMLGKSPYDFTHPDYHALIRERIRRQLDLGESAPPVEEKIIRLDGTLVDVEVAAAPVMYQGVMSIQAVLRDLTERKRAAEDMVANQRCLHLLGIKLAHVEEAERRRIAADLHDTVVQVLAATKLRVQQLRGETQPDRVGTGLNEIQELVERAITESRSLLFELSPPSLYELGLEAALECLAEKVQKEHRLAVTFKDDHKRKPLSDEARAVLYRAVQELLQNVIKHAFAKSVKMSTRAAGRQIVVEVADDGVGFDLDHVFSRKNTHAGFGLFHIRTRMDYLGGRFEVSSQPGRGTRVALAAPLGRPLGEV